VSKFQPRVLSRVPSIDRSKLLFPINIADFVYADGVQVMSAHQVKVLKEENDQGMSPLLDSMPALCPFSHLAAEDNKLQREIVLTNQEGKLYYATCHEYFVDLKCIEREFVDQ